MNRTQIVLLTLLALLGGFIAWLAIRNRQPPFVPSDADHAGMFILENCQACHDPDGDAPRGRNHPVGTDCLRCHGSGG